MKFLITIITFILGFFALLMDKVTTISSCFWFAYEPTPPEKGDKDGC
jgi:cyclic lactone autoinducer peptide